jgi:hypothetical protein
VLTPVRGADATRTSAAHPRYPPVTAGFTLVVMGRR